MVNAQSSVTVICLLAEVIEGLLEVIKRFAKLTKRLDLFRDSCLTLGIVVFLHEICDPNL